MDFLYNIIFLFSYFKDIDYQFKIPEINTKIEISFLGDVMIGGRVGDEMDIKGSDFVFGGTKDYLNSKDAVILNLETTVTNEGKRVNKTYTFKAKPQYLLGLKSFNKNLLVNLANNHMGDFGDIGIENTLINLDKTSIGYFGAGKNIYEANKLKIIKIKGIKIGLFGQNCIGPNYFKAGENTIGTSFFDKKIINNNVKTARKQGVDIIIYNAHCGIEYTNGPNKQQKEYYHFAIDSGVDLVIGHHPHRYQPIEIYKNKLIFYSLGDYIFDIFRGRRTQDGIIANIIIENKKIIKAEIIPVHIEGFGNTGFTKKVKKEIILNEIFEISKKFGKVESIKDGYIKIDKL